MAFHYKTQGIILKKRDQGEANCVFKVFTKEYGKLTLFAVSVRKITSKLRGGLDLFSLSKLEFVQGKQKKVLVQAISLRQPLASLQNLSRLQAAMLITNLVDKHMAEQEKDEKVWELLVQSFSELQDNPVPEKAYEVFAPRFMTLAGYGNKIAV
tara:strand:- start:772 stop:1233 length:462 start_codon:yes stop_codon:yes gene_type:complete